MDEVEFGRYRLIALIGEGGMGQVYKAHDTVMGRDVAIKVLPRELATKPGYEQRFRREALIAARLTEPHIIPIFESGEIDGRLYLVMPVISGIDVHTVLRRDGPMSPQRAVQVVEQLAAALNVAHQHGLVHRDIKPSNALMTGDDFVYLIDFGIAHDATATRLTRTGMMVGTVAYTAPERFTAGAADARADVYSLTCVLYECLTGAVPYPGNSMEQQISGHLTLDPPRPSKHRSDVAAGFDDVVALGMAKNPERRYQSARELASAARRALTSVPAPARDPHGGHTLFADLTLPARVDPQLSSRPARAPEPMWQQPPYSNRASLQQRPHPREPAGPPPWQPAGPPLWQPAGPPPWQPASHGHRNRWLALGIAALVVVVALFGVGIYFVTKNSDPVAADMAPAVAPTTIAAPKTAPPVQELALDGLLLNHDEINAAAGSSRMTIKAGSLWWNDTAEMSPVECLPLLSPMERDVYAGSGWTAARSQEFSDFEGPEMARIAARQGVVLFPSAQAAAAFVSVSQQKWSACANGSSFTLSDSVIGTHPWTVGELTSANSTFAATSTRQDGNSWACQRALTARNNVVIDTGACSHNITDEAVKIASQIAAKVPTM